MSADSSHLSTSSEPTDDTFSPVFVEEDCGSVVQNDPQNGPGHATDCMMEQYEDNTAKLSVPQQPTIFNFSKKEVTEPCWYCMMSLLREDLNLTQPLLQLASDGSSSPPGGKSPSYQTDPRPHFGIPNSSRSTPFPLWGSRGPREFRREEEEEEEEEEVCMCPHCNLTLPPDTLRWHEAKCLLFEGLKNTTATTSD